MNNLITDKQYFAKVAYHAYGAVTDFKNFRGDPMPAFEDLTDKIQEAWEAAALKVIMESRQK